MVAGLLPGRIHFVRVSRCIILTHRQNLWSDDTSPIDEMIQKRLDRREESCLEDLERELAALDILEKDIAHVSDRLDSLVAMLQGR